MNAFWVYFWPSLGAGLAVGIIAGAIGFRRRRYLPMVLGAILATGLAALWHGPLGAADKFTSEVEGIARQALVYNEIPEVSAHLHHGPLTRRILLSGPADNFQRSQLVIVMDQVPGVESASWSQDGGGTPLIVEGAGVALLGFLFGLLGAYLRELRRRYNEQWKW